MSRLDRRRLLRELVDVALLAADPRAAVRTHVTASLGRWPRGTPTFVIALGKAAPAMLSGVFDADRAPMGILVTTEAQALGDLGDSIRDTFEIFRGEHPVPGPESQNAGRRLLELVASLSPEARVLCLLSGGASALCEFPVSGISFDDIQEMTRRLLASGLPIEILNAARCAVSALKGGRLRALLGERDVVTLLVSDVPSDDPSIIGSGPLDAGGEALLGRLETLQKHAVFGALPVSVQEAIRTFVPVASLGQPSTVLLSGRAVAERVAEAARAKGLSVAIEGPLEGEARRRGAELAVRGVNVDCTVLYGETTVTLPAEGVGGAGGRNQELALAFAEALAATSSRVLLALATDGADGVSKNAGAIVDGETRQRGEGASGRSIAQALSAHDAAPFLEASGDALRLPATGTNVADITVILR